jgi:hypothetical protein
MAQSPSALLLQAAKLTSIESLHNFVFANPLLLKPDAQSELVHLVGSLAQDDYSKLLSTILDYVREIWSTVEKEPVKYNLGLGPLEILCDRVDREEISPEAADSLARDNDITNSLSSPYLRRLSGYCRGAAHQDKWRYALRQQRILRAAVDALPRSDAWEAVRGTSWTWITWTQAAAR